MGTFDSIHVHREGVPVERRRFPHHQPLGDLHRHEAVYRLDDRRGGRRRAEGGGIAGEVAQEVVDLVVGAQAPEKAGPALPLLPRRGPEDRGEQGLYAIWRAVQALDGSGVRGLVRNAAECASSSYTP